VLGRDSEGCLKGGTVPQVNDWVPGVDDGVELMRRVLEGLGPTNRIARQLVNRLELAEDRGAEAEAISDELDDIWQAVQALAARVIAAIDEGVAAAEDHANRP
jgi:hypothetical protein